MNLVNMYYVNIAMESVAAIFMFFLLFVIRRQQKQLTTRKQLGNLVLVEIGLLLCQITEWAVNMQEDITYKKHPFLFALDKIAVEGDIILFYSIFLFAYIYIARHIEFLRKHDGNDRKISKKLTAFLLIWILVPVALHFTSIWTGLFFTISEAGKVHLNYNNYWMIYLLCWFPALISTVLLIRNRKILGVRDVLLFLAYIYVPAIMLVIDIIYYTSFSYVAVAIIIFLIFVRIDIGQSDLLHEIELSNIKKESELRDTKIALVVSQIQPHFIYNTLNAIHYLVGKNPDYAQKIIKDFSKYLRMNMDSINDRNLIEFSQELEHIKTYLEIEQLRFDDLKVKYDIEVSDFFIPPLSIQPLVENAVKHGICQSDDGGTVLVSTKQTDDSIIITVEDNGAGFDLNEKKNDGRSHIGIENTKKRLKEICNAAFSIESIIDIGTKVTITIPKAG